MKRMLLYSIFLDYLLTFCSFFYFSFFGGIGAFFITTVIIYKHFYGGYSNHGPGE